jgi:hypothetical protein
MGKNRLSFLNSSILDGLVKSPKLPIFVIPAKAGIQEYQLLLEPGLRRGDGLGDFLRMCQFLNSLICQSLNL